MNGEHRNVSLMLPVQVAEIRKLIDTGRTVGPPEIDECDLSTVVRKMEL